MCKSGISGIMPYVESHGKFNVQTTSCYVVEKPASQRARSRVTGDLTLLKVNGQWYNRYHHLDHLFRTTVHPKQGTGGAYTGGQESNPMRFQSEIFLYSTPQTAEWKKTISFLGCSSKRTRCFSSFWFFQKLLFGPVVVDREKNQSIFNE